GSQATFMNFGYPSNGIAAFVSASQPYQSLNALQAFAPDLSILAFGVVDLETAQASNYWQNTWGPQLLQIISVAQKSGDVILVEAYPLNVATPNYLANLQSYRDVLYKIASAYKLPVVQLYDRENGLWNTNLFSNGDNVHRNSDGYQDEATAITNAMMFI